ncbi:hypothetical protein GCM10010124_16640 [Pilimelia terevasa]|uniref:DUF4360 domain-containing protein n=1 Tax=Pilimelia terevasa TaxID=53372 RepID=A0A8J3FIC8_9ACTN|nr:DUF4360 domain-containing protein [Pilimelia terevasa]GGK24780.1 hypothetical protein GCM10010124_16640 [Pilimelia terevasa]
MHPIRTLVAAALLGAGLAAAAPAAAAAPRPVPTDPPADLTITSLGISGQCGAAPKATLTPDRRAIFFEYPSFEVKQSGAGVTKKLCHLEVHLSYNKNLFRFSPARQATQAQMTLASGNQGRLQVDYGVVGGARTSKVEQRTGPFGEAVGSTSSGSQSGSGCGQLGVPLIESQLQGAVPPGGSGSANVSMVNTQVGGFKQRLDLSWAFCG